MSGYWWVALGAAVGAPARYLLEQLFERFTFGGHAWGTLGVNASGTALLGVLAGLQTHGHLSPTLYVLVGTGLCGAYTTYSTFAVTTVRLVRLHRWRGALTYTVLGLASGLAAAGVGLALGLAL